MPTLRDRVREALSAHEPGDREAARDLDAVLERANGARRATRRVARPLLVAPAFVAAALLLFLAFPRRAPVAPVLPMAAAKGGVHLYLNIAGEPADRAIALDLDSPGDL